MIFTRRFIIRAYANDGSGSQSYMSLGVNLGLVSVVMLRAPT